VKEKILIDLLAQKLTGELSVEGAEHLERLLAEDKALEEEAKLLEEAWRLSGLYAEDAYQPDERVAWEALQKRLKSEKPRPAFRRVWLQRLAAAVVLLLLVVGGYRFFVLQEDAFLTVKAGEETKTIRLPDGSTVDLFPATVLRYPRHFGRERRVDLEGEAYFQVAKDAAHSFVVSAQAGEVRVLGTRFLYSSRRSASEERVLVEEGKVAYRVEGTTLVVLVAGEAMTYHLAKAEWEKSKLNPNLLFWRTGRLVFRGVPLREVLDELEELFHVRFDRSEIESLLTCEQTLAFSNKPDLEEILQALKSHLHWEVERHGSVWHLRGGRCE